MLAVVTADTVLDVVRAAIARVMECDPAAVQGDCLLDDLGVDSLARVELAEIVESQLGPRIPGLRLGDDELRQMTTVDDAVDCVMAHIPANAGH